MTLISLIASGYHFTHPYRPRISRLLCYIRLVSVGTLFIGDRSVWDTPRISLVFFTITARLVPRPLNMESVLFDKLWKVIRREIRHCPKSLLYTEFTSVGNPPQFRFTLLEQHP